MKLANLLIGILVLVLGILYATDKNCGDMVTVDKFGEDTKSDFKTTLETAIIIMAILWVMKTFF